MLNGLLNGTVTDGSGASAGEVSNSAAALPVLFPPAECPILDLVLGPLDLDLLGLQIHLDRVVLDLTAVSGPGKLLGNLLCAITNLLNGGGGLSPLAALIAQLNQLLGLGG